jgi:hypothetical protein
MIVDYKNTKTFRYNRQCPSKNSATLSHPPATTHLPLVLKRNINGLCEGEDIGGGGGESGGSIAKVIGSDGA